MPTKASRTAVLVCQGRAAAHDRIASGRFSDPVAMSLLRDDLGGSLPNGHVLVAERR